MPRVVLLLLTWGWLALPASSQEDPAPGFVQRLITEEYPKEAIDALVKMGGKAVPALLDQADAEWWHQWARAAYVLRRIGARGVPQLTAALKSEDARRRRFAIEMLCDLEQAERCRPLLGGVHRIETAMTLCDHGAFLDEALPALLEIAGGPGQRRLSAVHYLGRYEGAVPALCRLLDSEDAKVRTGATNSLGLLADGSARAREALLAEYRSGDPVRKAAALDGLSHSAELDAGFFLDALDLGGEEVRKAVHRAIYRRWIEQHGPLGQLRTRALGHPDPKVRTWACAAVARTDRKAAADLLAMTADDNGDVVLAVLDAIEAIGDGSDAVRKALARAHTSGNERVQTEAAHVMARMDLGRREAIAWFIGLLPESKGADPYRQLHNFARLGPVAKEAVPRLTPFLKDARAIEAARALWSLTAELEPILPTLQRHLSDQWIRREAIVLAGEIGPPARSLVPLIAKALEDEEVWVRRDAVDALGRIRAAEVAAALRARLEDEQPVRRAAAAALYRLGALNDDATRALEGLAFELELDGSWDGEEWGPAEAAALRFRWEAGRPVPGTAGTAAWWTTFGVRRPYEFVELLGDMGAEAREAVPWLRRLLRGYHPYLVRRAARAALAEIQG